MPDTVPSPAESTFKGKGGLNIFLRSWRPAAPKAVVILSHGFNSHGGHYMWVGSQLAAKGFEVYALDHRGRGKSEGERFYVDSFDDYVADVATLVATAKAGQPGLPVYMLGHSAGGVIACGYVLAHPAELAGLICESFALEVPAPGFALAILRWLAGVLPHAKVLKLKSKDFSRDPAVLQMLATDPLMKDEKQPAHTVAEMLRASDRLKAGFPSMTLPVLIIHGSADKVTRPEGSRLFHATAGSKDKTLKIYDDFAHDPLSDIGKEQVLADIAGWIEARLPKANAKAGA